MRLITLLTAAMATLATAAPVATETVSVSDIWVRKDETATSSKISHVEFKLNGPGAKDLLCTRSNPSLPSGTFPCGKSGYTFQLKKGVNKADYAVTLHHKHKDGKTLSGTHNLPVCCHAGGNGPADYVCSHYDDLKMTLKSA